MSSRILPVGNSSYQKSRFGLPVAVLLDVSIQMWNSFFSMYSVTEKKKQHGEHKLFRDMIYLEIFFFIYLEFWILVQREEHWEHKAWRIVPSPSHATVGSSAGLGFMGDKRHKWYISVMNIFFNFILKTVQQSAIKSHQLPFKKPARFF